MSRQDARRFQEERVQGKGKAIISETLKGYRMVAVRNKIYYSEKWRLFSDFLFDFLVDVFGRDWFGREMKRPLAERHPVGVWYHKARAFQATQTTNSHGWFQAHPSGAIRSLLGLAYDLYLCAHNWRIPDLLMKRLKDPSNFEGAVYEAYVIGRFSIAGFTIEFEDEGDSAISHCEFTAIHRHTGRKFSVEAKAIMGATARHPSRGLKLHRKISDAFRKHAHHERVVFIELSQPDIRSANGEPLWLDHAIAEIEAAESDDRTVLPSGILFVTNRPFVHAPDELADKEATAATGFKIADFPPGRTACTFTEAVEARDRHTEMYELWEAIQNHASIPDTFDGTLMEELLLPQDTKRLLVGDRYVIPAEDGSDIEGVLEQGTVSPEHADAWCVFRTDDGQQALISVPLSPEEVALYKASPETFFGVPSHVGSTIKAPWDAFDFLYRTYSRSTLATLQGFAERMPDKDALLLLPQPELARAICMRWGEAMWLDKLRSDHKADRQPAT